MIKTALLTIILVLISFSKNPLDIAIDQSINQLKKEHGFILVGSGGSSFENKKRLLSLSFDVPNKLTVDEGRFLVINASNIILKNFDSKGDAIKNYLLNYPFLYENLDIALFNSVDKRNSSTYPILIAVGLDKRGVSYFFKKESGQTYFEHESYEEALQKLNDQ